MTVRVQDLNAGQILGDSALGSRIRVLDLQRLEHLVGSIVSLSTHDSKHDPDPLRVGVACMPLHPLEAKMMAPIGNPYISSESSDGSNVGLVGGSLDFHTTLPGIAAPVNLCVA